MGELIDLDRYRHRLRDELAADLLQHGCVRRNVSELPVPVEAWRRTARAAGRHLGRASRPGCIPPARSSGPP